MKKITAKVMSFFVMFMMMFTLATPINVAYANDGIKSPINITTTSTNNVPSLGNTGTSDDANGPVAKFVKFIQFVSIIGLLAMLLVFILNLIKLGTAGTNPRSRTDAMGALIWSGVAVAVLGISQLMFFFFFNLLKNDAASNSSD